MGTPDPGKKTVPKKGPCVQMEVTVSSMVRPVAKKHWRPTIKTVNREGCVPVTEYKCATWDSG